MTIKEIAEFTGRSKKTVCNWCEKSSQATCEKITQARKSNIAANLSLEETIEVLRIGKVSDSIISLLKENAKRLNQPQNAAGLPQNTQVLTIKDIPTIVAETIKLLMPMINKTDRPALEYRQDYYSIIGYANKNGNRSITVTEAQSLSRKAKELTIKAGKEVHKIPDERWGTMNTYPVEILEKVFEI